MSIFSKIFKGKEKNEIATETTYKEYQEIENDFDDIAYLSYGKGAFTIPVEGFVQGVKRMGMVKAFDMKSGRFIELKELGESLILYTPESGAIPLIHNTDEKYNFIKEFVFEGKRFDTYNSDDSEHDNQAFEYDDEDEK